MIRTVCMELYRQGSRYHSLTQKTIEIVCGRIELIICINVAGGARYCFLSSYVTIYDPIPLLYKSPSSLPYGLKEFTFDR